MLNNEKSSVISRVTKQSAIVQRRKRYSILEYFMRLVVLGLCTLVKGVPTKKLQIKLMFYCINTLSLVNQ